MRIFSAQKYMEAPPETQDEALSSTDLDRMDWRAVDDQCRVLLPDGDSMNVVKVRPEWCEEISEIVIDILQETVRQRDEAKRIASHLMVENANLREALHRR